MAPSWRMSQLPPLDFKKQTCFATLYVKALHAVCTATTLAIAEGGGIEPLVVVTRSVGIQVDRELVTAARGTSGTQNCEGKDHSKTGDPYPHSIRHCQGPSHVPTLRRSKLQDVNAFPSNVSVLEHATALNALQLVRADSDASDFARGKVSKRAITPKFSCLNLQQNPWFCPSRLGIKSDFLPDDERPRGDVWAWT
jgi:hypothetical protein